MKNQSSPSASAARNPARPVAVLRCKETFAMDPAPLACIFAEVGECEAEEMVCRALEDIARRLDSLQAHRVEGNFDDMVAPVRRVASIARQIGLTELAVSAEHVACTAGMRGGVALGATMARLERAFDSAVSQVWDFRKFETS